MRCGSRLIRDGDARAEVRAFCGEPADVQTRTILRRPAYNFGGRIYSYGDGYVEIPVETWTYNFGPYKLMRRVRFVDGLVDEVETLGYGYQRSARATAPTADARSDRRDHEQITRDEQHRADRQADVQPDPHLHRSATRYTPNM